MKSRSKYALPCQFSAAEISKADLWRGSSYGVFREGKSSCAMRLGPHEGCLRGGDHGWLLGRI